MLYDSKVVQSNILVQNSSPIFQSKILVQDSSRSFQSKFKLQDNSSQLELKTLISMQFQSNQLQNQYAQNAMHVTLMIRYDNIFRYNFENNIQVCNFRQLAISNSNKPGFYIVQFETLVFKNFLKDLFERIFVRFFVSFFERFLSFKFWFDLV